MNKIKISIDDMHRDSAINSVSAMMPSDSTPFDIFQKIMGLMVTHGYAYESVVHAIFDLADEYKFLIDDEENE